MKNFLVTIILLVLIVLFASLQSYWGGLVYFALSFLIILCIYWMVIFILQYITDYYKTFDEDFKLYCIHLINSTSVTTEQVNENIEFYKKQYKKSIIRDKIIDISKILVALSIMIACIIGMINV